MDKIAPVKGTRDFYPQEMAVRNWIFDRWRQVSIRNGFVEYDSPIFEYLQLYTQKSGEEIASQLFSLTDRGGRDLAIRPETTPSLARMVNQKINSLPRPIKWFSVSRLCRAERPQKGRLREFFQWNVDIIGPDNMLADAECIYTAVDFLRSVGLTANDVTVRISNRAMLGELLKGIGFQEEDLPKIYTLLDKRSKLPAEKFEGLAAETIGDESKLKKLMGLLEKSLDDFIKDAPEGAKKPIDDLMALFDLLGKFGIGDYCQFDINIVRGLAYYTGTVFEIFDARASLRAICGGGRYDNLLAGLGGQQVPAVGFGMGDVVLGLLLEEKGKSADVKPGLDLFVVYDQPSVLEEQGLKMVNALRQKGYSVSFDYVSSRSVAKQMKLANMANARYTIILSQEDRKTVSVKNMSSGQQRDSIVLDAFLKEPETFLVS